MTQRLFAFIDAQNMYRGARRAFFAADAPSRFGQFHPGALGQLIAARRTDGRGDRTLAGVRIYTGRPDAAMDPKGNAANTRQCQAWEAEGVEVTTRNLQYLQGRRPTEKGIDVAIAIDLLRLARSGIFDVAVLCSADTDLLPAIDAVVEEAGLIVEVAGWRNGPYGQRIAAGGRDLFCHWLYRDNYDLVRDDTDYTAG